jgi:CDP-diacylglycerol--glycerol-3-phosphate 3-phosphatidyltransferase
MNAKNILTVPNILTLSRLLSLIPVIILFRTGLYGWAGVIFFLAMLTDAFDGFIANRFGQRTRLGLYLDPVVDKVVILILFYEIAFAGFLPMPIAHLFLFRELLQNGIRAVAALKGEVVGANWMGKTKAFLQSLILVFGLMLPGMTSGSLNEPNPALVMAFIALTVAVLCLSLGFTAVFIYWNRSQFLEDAAE